MLGVKNRAVTAWALVLLAASLALAPPAAASDVSQATTAVALDASRSANYDGPIGADDLALSLVAYVLGLTRGFPT